MKVDVINTKFGDIEVEYSSFTKGFFIKKIPEKLAEIQGLKIYTTRDNSFKEFSKLEDYVKELVRDALIDFVFKRRVIVYQIKTYNDYSMNSLHFEYFVADESEKTQNYQGKENELNEYFIIDGNLEKYKKGSRNIFGQITHESKNNFVIIDYDEDIHLFLKKFDENFRNLKKSLVDFFDKDKIKQNVIDSKLNNSNLLS